ncbi:MAG: hypothetical protein A2350_17585 [Candidatus Raymondbacteria bacterium RifOxyB12_full_50_8]|nr:MAG: hypothetical protein A2350_17585 [Candidatus Raymondbacteria bacterium RifOxyB12_full_50_8]
MTGWLLLLCALGAWTLIAFLYRRAQVHNADFFAIAVTLGASIFAVNLGLGALFHGLSGAALLPKVWGIANSLLLVVAIPVLMTALRLGGLAPTWTMMQLSFALATVLTLWYPGGTIQGPGKAGLALSVIAIFMLGFDKTRQEKGVVSAFGAQQVPGIRWFVLALCIFILNGMSSYSMALGFYAAPDNGFKHKAGFVGGMGAGLMVFGSLALLVKRGFRKSGNGGSMVSGFKHGAIIGLCSVTGVHCSLAAFAFVPGYILYPVTSGGSTLLVTVLSIVLYRERAGIPGWLGFCLGVAGIVLLGIG